jgi:hypothetical protein
MFVEDPPPVPPMETAPRFQIFISGIVARHTFLVDSSTGTVRQLVKITREGREDYMAWVQIKTSK